MECSRDRRENWKVLDGKNAKIEFLEFPSFVTIKSKLNLQGISILISWNLWNIFVTFYYRIIIFPKRKLRIVINTFITLHPNFPKFVQKLIFDESKRYKHTHACKWFRHEDQFRCKKRKRERRIKKIYGSSGERRNIFVITVIRDRVRGEKLPGGRKGRKNWLSKKSSSLAVGHRSSSRCLVTASAPLWISPPVNGYS